jgi:hypothetical protein
VIRKLKFQLLQHPAYSTDLTPSDYHTFGLLNDMLHGYQLANDEEIKHAAHMHLHVQPKTFFANGIRKFVDLSNKNVEKLGDCIKICSCVSFTV